MNEWTKENLIAYRNQNGWERLTDDQIDQVLTILNSADETLRSLEQVSWMEPSIRFSVGNSGKNESN